MKTFASALLAAALLIPAVGTPAIAQQAPHSSAPGKQVNTPGKQASAPGKQVSKKASTQAHRFKKGEKFDRSRAGNYAVIDYRKYKNIKAPAKGYRYVRSGNDLLLVGITSGVVASVVSGQFR